MKRKIAFFKDEDTYECTKTKTYSKFLLSIVLVFVFFGLSINSVFAQQLDLRNLTNAYTPGKCPADDIQVLSASVSTGNVCNTCTGGSVNANLTIRINHKTESAGRYLAICGTIIESLPGGGTNQYPLVQCFGPLLKSSQQTGGGQNLANVPITFTCGSSLQLTNILLVWTAANGECPVSLANNPNGKYCWNNPNVTITPPFSASATHVDAACYGSSTGSVNLTPVGGTLPYTYAWTASNGGAIPSGQADDQDLSGIVAGTYSVVVTDANNCTTSVQGIVIGQNALAVPDITKDPGSYSDVCGKSAAQAQADVNTAFAAWLAVAPVPSGGTLPYASVVQSPTTPTPPLYTGGSTSVTWTVTDACGQTDFVTVAFTVSNPCNIICAPVGSPVSCYGGSNGSIVVGASGGNPPYAFHLFLTSDVTFANELQTLTDNTAPTEPGQVTFTGLAAENYTVLITDSAHDLANAQVCDGVPVNQPTAALSTQISDVDVLCYGAATGSINLTPSGGTPPYTFTWTASNGGVIPTGQADDQDLSGLVAGTYSVVITDANGTTGGCRAENNAVISQPDAALSSQISDVDVLCYGAATGSINLTPSGGTPPYTYAWTASNGGVIPAGQADNQDLSGLVAGTYSVVITDANGSTGGCRAENSAVISQPESGLSSQISDVDVLCYGAATGSINLTPSGGVPPYAYAWTASNGGVIPAGQADDQDLSGLVAGTYSVVITDANGNAGACRAENSAVISQPDAALSSQISDIDVLCYGVATGSINLTPSGGTPPYVYAWTASNGGVIPAGQADDQDLSGLVAGTYSVVITDANGSTGGCRAENSAVISQPAAALDLVSLAPSNASCTSGDGTILATISGGTPPYSIKLDSGSVVAVTGTTHTFNNVTAGLHTVTVYDANYATSSEAGCTDSGEVTIETTPCPEGHIFPTQTACCHYISGTASNLLYVCTTTKENYVTNAIPGVFFYYANIVAPSSSFTIEIKQTKDGDLNKYFNVQNLRQIRLFTDNCENKSFTASIINGGHDARYVIAGATPGATYVVSVKYDVKSILGATYSGGDLNSTYTFSSYVNSVLVGNSIGTIDALSGCHDNTPLPGACPSTTTATTENPIAVFTAYPVPFKEYINVRYEFNYQSKARIEIYDAKGMFVMSYDDADAYFNKEVRLNTTFNQGEGQMFIVKVITDREVSTQKVVSKN
jgi:hypothetical protein